MWLILSILFGVFLSCANGKVVEEGEIMHFCEVYQEEKPDGSTLLTFGITTYNKPFPLAVFQLDTLQNHTLVSIAEWSEDEVANTYRVAPLGDAYQIHSVVILQNHQVFVYSVHPYEPSIGKVDTSTTLTEYFVYRNLIFMPSSFHRSQNIQQNKTIELDYEAAEEALLGGYFPQQGALNQIDATCFGGQIAKCGIDRDTGLIEHFHTPDREPYMYRAFNFSVPWECSWKMCTFEELDKDTTYQIPEDLRTFSGQPPPGRRVAMIPLLTIQSQLVKDKIDRRDGRIPASAGSSSIQFVLILIGYFLVFMSK